MYNTCSLLQVHPTSGSSDTTGAPPGHVQDLLHEARLDLYHPNPTGLLACEANHDHDMEQNR